MTDADRMVAHGMGYESAIEATGSTAAPGHEEALAELAAENERLRAGMRVLAKLVRDYACACPIDDHECQSGYICDGMAQEDGSEQELDCWCKWALAEADARKAGDAQ